MCAQNHMSTDRPADPKKGSRAANMWASRHYQSPIRAQSISPPCVYIPQNEVTTNMRLWLEPVHESESGQIGAKNHTHVHCAGDVWLFIKATFCYSLFITKTERKTHAHWILFCEYIFWWPKKLELAGTAMGAEHLQLGHVMYCNTIHRY